MSILRRSIVLATTLATLGGCVLLIDPIETTDHCGIQGTGECAECLRRNCQVPIDRCCAFASCTDGEMLPGLDACGRGATAACADILGAPRIVAQEEDVRSCAQASCGAICTQGSAGTGTDTRPKWTCTAARDTPNDCALCVYQSCTQRIDECCADSSCKNDPTIQTDVAACVSGDAPGCAFLLDDDRGTSGQQGVLRRCIDERCAAKCMGNRLPHTKCTIYSSGDYCSCENSEIAGTQRCNPDTITGADCVLGTDGCSCGQYACTDDAITGGCECSFRGGVSGTSCTAPSGKVCCVKQTDTSIECECRFSSCSASSNEVEIASCSREDVLDWAGAAQVTSCSR